MSLKGITFNKPQDSVLFVIPPLYDYFTYFEFVFNFVFYALSGNKWNEMKFIKTYGKNIYPQYIVTCILGIPHLAIPLD